MSSPLSSFRSLGMCFIPLCVVLTVCGSFLIFLAFYRKPSLRNHSNVYFLSLVTADLLTAGSVMPIEIVSLYYQPVWPFPMVVCKLWNTLFVAFSTMSVCNLCAISVERLWTLLRPFRYDSSTVSSTTLKVLVVLWMYGLLSGVYSFFIWDNNSANSICKELSAPLELAVPLLTINVLIPYGTCIAAYGKVFKISHNHAKSITSTSYMNSNMVNSKGRRQRLIPQLLARKSTVTIGLLVGSFTICCFPFFIFHVIDGAFDEKLPNRYYVGNITKWLFFVCSSTNWALYGFLNKDFRQSIFQILKKFKIGRNKVSSIRISNRETTNKHAKESYPVIFRV